MDYGGSRPDAAAQLGRSGDGGVDGVINEDRLGLDRVYSLGVVDLDGRHGVIKPTKNITPPGQPTRGVRVPRRIS